MQLKNTLEGHLGVALLHQLAFPGCAEAGQELVEDLHRLSQRRLLVVLAHSLPGLVFLELFKNNCYDESHLLIMTRVIEKYCVSSGHF